MEEGLRRLVGLVRFLRWFWEEKFSRQAAVTKIYFSQPTFLGADDKFPHRFAKVFFGSGLSFGM